MDTDITVVVMTRNRAEELVTRLQRLTALPDAAPIVVVDNGSSDGTAERVRERLPQVELLRLERNLGIEARNIAGRRVDTPYIAFSEDDSWWTAGALTRVVELFHAHPPLGAVTGHIIVEPDGRDDPTSLEMRDSAVQGAAGLPGVPVLGFLACTTAVRRSAFLEVGAFNERFHFGGEEQLLATDLAAAGWEVRYVPDVVVAHRPSTSRDRPWRRRREVRSTLWFVWLRRPVGPALRRSLRLLGSAGAGTVIAGLAAGVRGLPWVLRERRVVPDRVERQLRLLESSQDSSSARRYAA